MIKMRFSSCIIIQLSKIGKMQNKFFYQWPCNQGVNPPSSSMAVGPLAVGKRSFKKVCFPLMAGPLPLPRLNGTPIKKNNLFCGFLTIVLFCYLKNCSMEARVWENFCTFLHILVINIRIKNYKL